MTQRRGVTLIELIAAIAIIGLVGAAAAPTLWQAYRSFLISSAKAKVNSEVAIAIREIAKTVQAAETYVTPVLTNSQLQVAVLSNKSGPFAPIPPNVPEPADFDYITNPGNYRVYRYRLVGSTIVRDWNWSTGGGGLEEIIIARDIATVEFWWTGTGTNQNDLRITVSAQRIVAGQPVTASSTTTVRFRGRRAGT